MNWIPVDDRAPMINNDMIMMWNWKLLGLHFRSEIPVEDRGPVSRVERCDNDRVLRLNDTGLFWSQHSAKQSGTATGICQGRVRGVGAGMISGNLGSGTAGKL